MKTLLVAYLSVFALGFVGYAQLPDGGPMPRKLNICGHRWEVYENASLLEDASDGPADELDGVEIPDKRRIVLRPGYSLAYRQQILQHEVLHACFAEVRLPDAPLTEDEVVDSIDECVARVYHDNPDFQRFMAR